LILPVTETVGSDEAIVVEGDGASGKWVRVSVQSRSSAMDLDRLLRLAVLPEGARLNWAATSTAGGELIWTAEGAGDETARIISCERFFPPNAPTNSPAETEAGGRHPGLSLTSTWLRSASGGKLVSHGAWERGTPLPAAREDGLGPPSWLAAGLPQGVGVLLGRSKNDQDQEIWVRLIGFSED